MKESHSRYSNNAAVYGGAISLQNTSVEINRTSFSYNSAFRAGVVHLEQYSNLYTFKSTYENNGAYY